MNTEIKIHKLKFDRTLVPFKVMLVNRRSQLSYTNWIDLVNRTKEGILSQPDQYLGTEFPDVDTLEKVIDKIFVDFLRQQKV